MMWRQLMTDRQKMRLSVSCAWLGSVLSLAVIVNAAFAQTVSNESVEASAASAESPAATPQKPPSGGAKTRFDSRMLRGAGGLSIDISQFEQGNPLIPGTYRADLYVNQNQIGRAEIVIKPAGSGVGEFCLTRPLLDQVGLDFGKLPDDRLVQQLVSGACIRDLGIYVPGASVTFDMGEVRLDATIAQIFLRRRSRGYVDPEYWDAGINAGFINYNINANRNENNGLKTEQVYAGANVGVNLLGWRLRHNSSYSSLKNGSQSTTSDWQNINTYVQHDVTALRSQLVLGQSNTSGELFDSVGFTGVQLFSDDRMLPESTRGFAPVIRGVAESNARVRIYQGGNLVYETTVPPGEFQIDDMYATGYAGDFQVRVTEANGVEKSFTVPYASLPQLLRPGISRYSLTGGKLRNTQYQYEPWFGMGFYQYGVNNLLTLYTGAVVADHYTAVQTGTGWNTPFGALSLDVIRARTQMPDNTVQSGYRWGGAYSETLQRTQTTFNLTAYRYSSGGYLSLQDMAAVYDAQEWDDPSLFSFGLRQRSRYSASLTQQLGERGGQLFFNGLSQDYWDRAGRDTTYQAGYSNRIGRVGFSISMSRTRNAQSEYINQYYLQLTMPLGRESNVPTLRASATYNDSGRSGTALVGVDGSLGKRNELNYHVFVQDDYARSQDNQLSAGGSLQYQTTFAQLQASGSSGDHFNQVSLGMSGALVFHPGGITAAPYIGESIGVIEAKGATGARLASNDWVTVDGSGYAIAPYLLPYMQNEVALDPKGSSRNVELQITSQQVAPRAGAIVMLKYPTESGRPLLMRLRREDGSAVPMGANALDAKGSLLGSVGQGGRLFMRENSGIETLTLRWGDGADGQCQANPVVPPAGKEDLSFTQLDVSCLTELAPTPTNGESR